MNTDNRAVKADDLMGENPSSLRKEMVDEQLIPRGISDPAILKAMGDVPREEFVPPHLADLAYKDTALPIGEDQTISQPYMVALMTESLDLTPDSHVLEIGTGSGYAAAVLSRVSGQVYTVERHAKLAQAAEERFRRLGYQNIQVHVGDGTLGWRKYAPYDGIVVTAGGPVVPESLLDQLKVGANLIIPIAAEKNSQNLLRIHRKDQDEYQKEDLGAVRFVPLIGEEGWREG
jgi:protein-L-isoaspartate(D-aspartate) O-methyltransferase